MFYLSYLFTLYPPTSFFYANYAFILVAVLFLGSFILEYFRKKIIKNTSLRKALKGIPTSMWIIALATLVMTLARLAGVPIVSMRFWWLILFFVVLWFIYRTGRKYNNIESTKEHFAKRGEEHHKINKYLPKKKKK